MKSLLLIAILTCIIMLNLNAQVTNPIIAERENRKEIYQQNGQKLSPQELERVLRTSQESAKEYNKSKSLESISTGFGGSGLILFCAGSVGSLAAWIGNHGKESTFGTISNIVWLSGVGLIPIGFSIHMTANSHLKKSIYLYNESGKTVRVDGAVINLGFAGKGAGIQLRF